MVHRLEKYLMTITEVRIYCLQLPLYKPYRVAYKTHTSFDPYIVEVHDNDGRNGWGEAYIPEGYNMKETPEVGWNFCRSMGEKIVGMSPSKAKDAINSDPAKSPMAATALVSAIEFLEDNSVFRVNAEKRISLLAALGSKTLDQIPDEVESILERGFKTIKVKVGWTVKEDLDRVEVTQKAVAGRALVRLDANHSYSVEDACRFAHALNPAGIELFEQPCGSDEWDKNATVAKTSPVPVMLDESIFGAADVERAATMDNVKFCKLKLKRAGGIDQLMAALTRCRELKMGAVVGDGVATDLGNWMEACCARLTTDLTGEMNGFLKSAVRLFENPLTFEAGEIILKNGYRPVIDRDALMANCLGEERFSKTQATISVAQ